MRTMIKQLEQLIQATFHNPDLIKTAFRHTSYANEQASKQLQHNERLEFLGDAVLEVLMSEFLYQQYPTYTEGQLTRMRAQLVCEPSLAFLAREYRFDTYLQLGRGEEVGGGRGRDSILADCFEAFLGAVYLDCGIDVARSFLAREVFTKHEQLLQQIAKDYKTLFQERVQKRGAVVIQYRIIEQTGPQHDQTFTTGLYVNDELVATGTGKSKKQAEMQAAQIGYQRINAKGEIKRVFSEN
ncbi:MAG: ribonuclease III [Aerococcaceae bacterium]|nr:ribonuclease III [Aerococcaceae bacterium]